MSQTLSLAFKGVRLQIFFLAHLPQKPPLKMHWPPSHPPELPPASHLQVCAHATLSSGMPSPSHPPPDTSPSIQICPLSKPPASPLLPEAPLSPPACRGLSPLWSQCLPHLALSAHSFVLHSVSPQNSLMARSTAFTSLTSSTT